MVDVSVGFPHTQTCWVEVGLHRLDDRITIVDCFAFSTSLTPSRSAYTLKQTDSSMTSRSALKYSLCGLVWLWLGGFDLHQNYCSIFKVGYMSILHKVIIHNLTSFIENTGFLQIHFTRNCKLIHSITTSNDSSVRK